MAGLTVENLSDGLSQNVDTGGVIPITVQAVNPNAGANAFGPRSIFAQWQSSIPTVHEAVGGLSAYTLPVTCVAFATGDCNPTATAEPVMVGDITASPGSSYFPAAWIQFSANLAPGNYYISVMIVGATGSEYCTIQLRVLPYFNLPLTPLIAWTPVGMADLQVSMDLGTVNSGVLSRRNGIKQGSDFSLAVMPTQNGSLVTTGVTAMSLSILPSPGYLAAPLTFIATGTPPTCTEIGTDPTKQYYTISGNLGGAMLRGWMQQINDAAAKASPPLPAPDTLMAWAQLSITTSAGVFVSQSFQFPILQSLNPS